MAHKDAAHLAELIRRTKSSDPEVAQAAKKELEQHTAQFNRNAETRLGGVNSERRTS